LSHNDSPICVVDDDASMREALRNLILSEGLRVETFASAEDFLAGPPADGPRCLVLDVQLPGLSGLDLQEELTSADVRVPIIFLTGRGDIPMSVRAMKAGAMEFFTKPIDDQLLLRAIRRGIARDEGAPHSQRKIAQEDFGDMCGTSAVLRSLAAENVHLHEEIRTDPNFEGIVGEAKALKHVLKLAQIVAPTDSTVLILGETGTGKELIARAIHDRSGRREHNFVKVNCAAIPSSLLESELFGHEKGAFTGAIERRTGRFEAANGGTLFLDEVGEIPLELQPKLLRVLQEQEFERVGGSKTMKVDVRVVAATNRDLAGMVKEQRFRDDLYYRLNVFPIEVPPLRERAEDIPALVRYFVHRFARRMKRRIEIIPSEALEAMERYAWPGNVRELANLIERATILSPGPTLKVPLGELIPIRPPAEPARGDGATTLEELERAHILRVLDQVNWVVGGPRGAAARLGMNRTTLHSRMNRFGITRPTSLHDAAESERATFDRVSDTCAESRSVDRRRVAI